MIQEQSVLVRSVSTFRKRSLPCDFRTFGVDSQICCVKMSVSSPGALTAGYGSDCWFKAPSYVMLTGQAQCRAIKGRASDPCSSRWSSEAMNEHGQGFPSSSNRGNTSLGDPVLVLGSNRSVWTNGSIWSGWGCRTPGNTEHPLQNDSQRLFALIRGVMDNRNQEAVGKNI